MFRKAGEFFYVGAKQRNLVHSSKRYTGVLKIGMASADLLGDSDSNEESVQRKADLLIFGIFLGFSYCRILLFNIFLTIIDSWFTCAIAPGFTG